MSRRKSRSMIPVMLLWSKGAQERFSRTVEALQSVLERGEALAVRLEAAAAVIAAKRQRATDSAHKAVATRRARQNGPAEAAGPPPCPRCGAPMTGGAPHGDWPVQWECRQCGMIVVPPRQTSPAAADGEEAAAPSRAAP